MSWQNCYTVMSYFSRYKILLIVYIWKHSLSRDSVTINNSKNPILHRLYLYSFMQKTVIWKNYIVCRAVKFYKFVSEYLQSHIANIYLLTLINHSSLHNKNDMKKYFMKTKENDFWRHTFLDDSQFIWTWVPRKQMTNV